MAEKRFGKYPAGFVPVPGGLGDERSVTLEKFIEDHREELDTYIAKALKMEKNPYPNDEERRGWILNDEGLYRWARQEGVEI